MEIENLIEITPEIRKEAFDLIQVCERLKQFIKEQGKHGHFDISISNHSVLTIYDRYEYSKDGEDNNLGFFVHRFYPDGEYQLDFIAEENEEAEAFRKAFYEAQEAENGKNG